jgi:MFS family permease
MKNKEQWLSILIVAMSLATAWAIRGQFGHEQGAAWAGAVGGLALIMVSKRKDWYNKMVLVALASAVGWGAGGMISYGVVVGYGFADNFINAFYGLSMLFVIGALFGLLGGGLVGLVLDDTKKRKVKWGSLMAEMVAGGLIGYFFLVEQIGFKMTPPRSEAWAIIFGAGLAMLWYMAREKRNSAIRVAIFSGLGGGFGFAFGNFLQVIGNVMEIQFNMWNVMEYSIGFFGGLGMAYGVFSSKWTIDEEESKKWINRAALLIVVVLIPVIVYRESLTYEHFFNRLGDISKLDYIASISTTVVAIILVLMSVILLWKLKDGFYKKKDIALFFFIYLAVYIFISYAVTGLFAGNMALNHHLYILNIILIFVLFKMGKPAMFDEVSDQINTKKWLALFLILIIFIAIITVIAINTHGELGGSHNRFPIN